MIRDVSLRLILLAAAIGLTCSSIAPVPDQVTEQTADMVEICDNAVDDDNDS